MCTFAARLAIAVELQDGRHETEIRKGYLPIEETLVQRIRRLLWRNLVVGLDW